jgi:Ni/Co efflux regulator RcnB
MSKKWIFLVSAALVLSIGLTPAFADHDHDEGHGNGHANGHAKHEAAVDRRVDRREDRGDDRREVRHEVRHAERHGYYGEHDRDLRNWYRVHYDHLPPGLAKRDRLPPGLERQLVLRGTLPPGLRREMHPCPIEVVRYLPPPPVGYMHTIIGGHIVLVNRKTFFVLDIYNFGL